MDMQSLIPWLIEYRMILAAVAASVSLLIFIWRNWETVSFYFLRMHYSLPMIGKRAMLARNIEAGDDGWFESEKTLCKEFEPYISAREVEADPEFYAKSVKYLGKAREDGRAPLPMLGWLLLAAMVFVEAMGFSYVLAGYTIPGASEAMQQKGALGIAFLISGLLVFLTHQTGHELHLASRLGHARYARKDQTLTASCPNISIDDDDADDSHHGWQKILNRMPHRHDVSPKYVITIVTAIFVVLVATGATYVRGQVLEKQLTEQHHAGAGDYSDPYGELLNGVPDFLKETQAASDSKQSNDVEAAERKGGWATFIVLAVIFIFLQIMGVIIGSKTGFAGHHSLKAYRVTHKFTNKRAYTLYHQNRVAAVRRIVGIHLKRMQDKLFDSVRNRTTNPEHRALCDSGSKRNYASYVVLEGAQESAAALPEVGDSSRAASTAAVALGDQSAAADLSVASGDEQKISFMVSNGYSEEEARAAIAASKKPKLSAEEFLNQMNAATDEA